MTAYIVDGTGKAREQAQHCKADAEARPQAKLSLELRLVSKSGQYLLIGSIFSLVDWDVIAAQDGSNVLLCY